MNLNLRIQTLRSYLGSVFLLFSFLSAQAQQTTVQGTVSSSNGEALIGVSITDLESGKGAMTDTDGKFSISLNANSARLRFTYVGYKEQTELLNGRTRLSIILQENQESLDELVVIGYGVTKKSDLTGSVASIKSESLEKFPTANVTEMLRGQAAGLNVSLDNSEPGGASRVLVRGVRSLSGGQSPLFIVDGMIVPHINDLNSNDVASIEVLKDASSQAIYGSRASNGVILITTKRGKEGKTTVDLSVYTGVQDYKRNFDLYTPEEYSKLRFWAKYNEGMSGIGTPENPNYQAVMDDAIMLQSFTDQKYTNWENLMLTNAPQTKYDVSLRGGTTKMKYSASAGYLDQKGIVKGSDFTRANLRSNVDFAPAKWVDLGVNFAFSRALSNSVDGGFSDILTMPQLAQAYDDNGNILREANTSGEINPLWRVKEYKASQENDYLNLAGHITFKPFKNFTYRVNANLRTNSRETGNYRTKLYPNSTGTGQLTNFNRSTFLVENVLNYSYTKDIHRIQATLIHAFDEDLQKTLGMNFLNATTDIFDWNVVGDSEISGAIRSITRTRSQSYAARVQYTLQDRYLLTASVRRDGASVFGADNKWANFPSVALAWRINEEEWLKDVNWLSDLKARVSYGVVGNWAIPAYRTLGLSNAYEYLFGNQLSIGYLPSNQLINPNLKWETTHSVNYGLDYGFLKNRIRGTVEYYKTRTKDLLIQRTVPSITGYNTMWDNLGETESSGFEFSVQGDIVRKRAFDWTSGFTLSTQRSKIVKIDGRHDEQGMPINDLSNNWFIGQPINVTYNYVFAGIWQQGETPEPHQYLPGDAQPKPGDIKILDHNGDGKITIDDRKVYNLMPNWYATWNNSFRFKHFDLQAEFYTVQGITKNNPYLYSYNQGGSLNGKKNGIKVDYWTPENPSTTAPRPQFTASVPYMGLLGLQDASYLRLRSLTLGYSLPKAVLSKIGASKARIYTTATNLFTITDYQSYSPEKEPGSYPEARTYVLGLNLSF
jgi:TonB-linked SusC/RagA family outer membrane protein